MQHPLSYRFRKIEWLGDSKTRDKQWLIDSIPPYQPIALRPNIEDQCMFPDDLTEQKRLYEQDKAGGFINNWLNYFRDIENPLREYCALFWHEHMPCGSRGSRTEMHLQQNQLTIEMYRKHALGDFKSFLLSYYSNPSCMYFLDIHRSYKENPNENFPRELLELYTLGEGNYTITDVKEIARAFTGLHFNPEDYNQGSFFTESEFDDGQKTIFGKTGNFKPENVIDLILEKQDCAKFITKKALLFFVGRIPSQQALDDCADVYYKTNYTFLELVKKIIDIMSDYGGELGKVKSPIEHIVFFQRQLGLKTIGHKTNQQFLRLCGQYPLNPWNVKGWTNGKNWLEGEHLMHRSFFPLILVDLANRQYPRSSTRYKLSSRLNNGRLRNLRFLLDAKWDENYFYNQLSVGQMTVSNWLLQTQDDYNLQQILTHPKYQSC